MIISGRQLVALSLTAVLAGCASGTHEASAPIGEGIARELNARVIDCTLPFLNTHAVNKAVIRYQYRHGATRFESNDPALSTHLEQCASTSDGPDVTFEREIEVWASNEE